MHDDEIAKELIFRVLISRARGESHLAKGSLAGLSVRRLIEAVSETLSKEPATLELNGTFVIVGDIHGNIDDLLRVFEKFQYPPYQSYLFLGDYVDRGENSIESIIVLYSLKLLFPEHIFLLRGNHECEAVTRNYGFKDECFGFFKKKRTYKRFCQSFTHLPLAAVVNDETFCVHGGLSPSIRFVSEIEEVVRKPVTDIGRSVAEHFLWGDPCNKTTGFADSPRGVGFLFGADKVDEFLDDNDLKRIIRAHEYCADGMHMRLENCLTIFTCCDYCGKGNDAAVVLLKSGAEPSIKIFKNCKQSHKFLMPEWLLEDARGFARPVESDPNEAIALNVLLC